MIQQELSQEQMHKNIQDMFAKIANNIKDIHSKQFAFHFKNEADKKKKLRLIFQKMKEVGVDPGNLDHVRGFMKNLKDAKPDIHQLFAKSLDGLMTEKEPPVRLK